MWFLALTFLFIYAIAVTAFCGRIAARRLGVSWRETLVWLGVFAEPADHEAAMASRAERRARDARKARELRRRASARGSAASSRTMARRVA